MKTEKYDNLLKPNKIGNLQIKNSMVMAPMVTNYCADDGAVTERFKAYHEARAQGGVGMIIIEAAFVHPSGKGFSNQVGVYKDELVTGLKELTDVVHKHDAKIAMQLHHGGRQTYQAVVGACPIGPSSISCPVCQEEPKEMTISEIQEIVKAFGQGARRAKEAGFDAVEIHGAHGYLLNQFLSPYSNKREDEYGGSLENRMRFPLEIIDSVRKEVGDNYPVIYRISSEEFVEGGLTLEDSKSFAKILVDKGVDAINVSGGVYESAAMIIQPAAVPQGVYVDNAFAIKEAIDSKVPVMVVGRIKDPLMAEQILEDGKSDFIVMGRALIADPELPNKIAAGDIHHIRKCIACNQGCIDRLFQNIDIGCLVNAVTGRELKYDLETPAKSANKKKVVIVGSGPAGLEAARVAAIRGHEVVLYEKTGKLGGQMNIAAVPPFKDEINEFTEFLIQAIKELGVKIIMEKEADIKTIKDETADIVILATGSVPMRVECAISDNANIVNSHEVLMGDVDAKGKIVVIGGGLAGSETAEHLADQGKEVTILEMQNDIAQDMGMLVRALLLGRIAEKNIKVLTNSKAVKISKGSVIFEKDGVQDEITGIDTVVIAIGVVSDNNLSKALDAEGIKYTNVGDCMKPQQIIEAVWDACDIAYNI